jgi:hypothetical protein
MDIQNTFWTIIDNSYYRIHNGILKYAPVNTNDSSVLKSEESCVEVISIEILELVNQEFNSSFTINDFEY